MNRDTDDPTRLTVVGATDLERRLIEAAGAEQPSPELTRRMGLALGLSVAAATAAGAAPATAVAATTKVVAGKSILGWATAGLVAATITGGAIGVWISSRPTSAPPVVVTAAPAIDRTPVEIAAAPARVHAARRHAAPAPRVTDLRAEIALVDAARSAVRSGAPERALALLRRYAATYPAGTFRPEAAALRIEALAANGQTAEARTLARDFVAKHPDSPLNERLARIASDPSR